MQQSDVTLKGPFAFVVRGGLIPLGVFPFPIAPQRFTVTLPSRGAIHQTLDSNFLDEFSGERSVLATCTLRGTFGYKVGPFYGSLTTKALEVLYETFNGLARETKAKLDARWEFLALSRLYYWRVWVQRVHIAIQSQDPLLYFYEITMVRLEDMLSPVGLAKKASGMVAAGAQELGALF
jgi:hypothetical protein